MELSELRQVLPTEQPAFRAAQVYRAIYNQKVSDLVQISTLPASLRTALAAHAELGLPVADRVYDSGGWHAPVSAAPAGRPHSGNRN